MITTLDDFVREFEQIKAMGWVPTHRPGPTGIGKTLEDLLGIAENNMDEPDFGIYELKSVRTNATSMLTMFTKAPQPPRSNRLLLNKFGYVSDDIYGNAKIVLHATLSADKFTSVRGNNRLKIHCAEDGIYFESQDGIEDVYYKRDVLRECFNNKYRGTFVYAYADVKRDGREEQFHFVKAYAVSGFSYDEFAKLLDHGVIKVDIRIGQYPNGGIHDHGTGFRIRVRDQVLLFKNKERLV